MKNILGAFVITVVLTVCFITAFAAIKVANDPVEIHQVHVQMPSGLVELTADNSEAIVELLDACK